MHNGCGISPDPGCVSVGVDGFPIPIVLAGVVNISSLVFSSITSSSNTSSWVLSLLVISSSITVKLDASK